MFNNIFVINKQKKLKVKYENLKNQIDNKILEIYKTCNENMNDKLEFMYLYNGDINSFNLNEEEVNKAFERTVKSYKKRLIRKYILPQFGKYKWCEEKYN